jgi:hypothetical protein
MASATERDTAPIPTFYQLKDFVPELNRSFPRHLNEEYVHLSDKQRQTVRQWIYSESNEMDDQEY